METEEYDKARYRDILLRIRDYLDIQQTKLDSMEVRNVND